ncbi:MAG: DMT family transporter [Campylobacterota bacterium]
MVRVTTTFVILAAFFWGLTGGIAGILISHGWEPFVISLYRGTIGLIFALFWLILSPKYNGFDNPKLWLWAIIAGLGVAGNFSFYFISIKEGGVAIASTLMYCAPIFVYLASFALKIEKPTVLKCIAIALVLVGIVMLTRIYSVDADAIGVFAVITGLLSGLCYAIFIFGFKYAANYSSAQGVLTIAFSVLVVILMIITNKNEQVIAAITSQYWLLFILLGLLGAGISFFLYVKGLYYTPPAVASIIAMIEPVTASLFSITILDEKLSIVQYIGMGLILFIVTILSFNSSNNKIEKKSTRDKP